MNSKTLIKELKAAGWKLVRINGSHHHFRHPASKMLMTVPHPKKDLGQGLVSAIRKSANLERK